ncbi:hypothetical protein WG907_14110 [Sphingobium sp. AN558]|uniref:hypothetical protein n=1 Tax=Sphingobium sp. AN558 TaxID=3133442 RepID=UPI0030C17EB2
MIPRLRFWRTDANTFRLFCKKLTEAGALDAVFADFGRQLKERGYNAAKSKVRARVEYVFARQRDQMGLFIRIIGTKRAEARISLANVAYNMRRLIFR